MSQDHIRPCIPFPTLLIEEGAETILVVADLHIGWEVSLVEKGIHLPSQMSRLQTKLLEIIMEYKPTHIIFLGDIKQMIPQISYEEWKNVPEFFKTIQKSVKKISVTLGNHDGDLKPLVPSTVNIFSSGGMVVGDKGRIGLFHGHAWPSQKVLQCEVLIMGHIHPILSFKDQIGLWTMRQIWVTTQCDSRKLAKAYLKYLKIKSFDKPEVTLNEKLGIELKEPKLVIMPAFNDLVGGVSINKMNRGLMGPLLGSGSVLINEADLYLLDGTLIGSVKQIREHLGE